MFVYFYILCSFCINLKLIYSYSIFTIINYDTCMYFSNFTILYWNVSYTPTSIKKIKNTWIYFPPLVDADNLLITI